jgi:uncharacterized protein (DUF1501 family)
MNRRRFLKALSAIGVSSATFPQQVFAQIPTTKTLVFVFLRGALDGLSAVVPYGDPEYAKLRAATRLAAPGAGANATLRLDSTFSLHPALKSLMPLFEAKQLAIVHAVGQQQASRSHFDAQDFLESGAAGRKTADGFLGRASRTGQTAETLPLRSVALSPTMPQSLLGDSAAVAFPSLQDFRMAAVPSTGASFESMYASAVDDALRGAGGEAFDSLHEAKRLVERTAKSQVAYSNTEFSRRMRDIATLIRSNAGTRIAVTEMGGFDTHLGQGASTGRLASRLTEFGDGLGQFAADLGQMLQHVCVVAVTEFGRTARENGTGGTDHGTASALFVLGGGVRGGRVVTDWPGLAPRALFEGRDLKGTTDVRQVLAECLEETLRIRAADVLPDFAPNAHRLVF